MSGIIKKINSIRLSGKKSLSSLFGKKKSRKSVFDIQFPGRPEEYVEDDESVAAVFREEVDNEVIKINDSLIIQDESVDVDFDDIEHDIEEKSEVIKKSIVIYEKNIEPEVKYAELNPNDQLYEINLDSDDLYGTPVNSSEGSGEFVVDNKPVESIKKRIFVKRNSLEMIKRRLSRKFSSTNLLMDLDGSISPGFSEINESNEISEIDNACGFSEVDNPYGFSEIIVN